MRSAKRGSWVLEVGGDLDLVQETLATQNCSQFGPQHLNRDVAIVLDIVSEIDGRHAAEPECVLDRVASREGVAEAMELVIHTRIRCDLAP